MAKTTLQMELLFIKWQSRGHHQEATDRSCFLPSGNYHGSTRKRQTGAAFYQAEITGTTSATILDQSQQPDRQRGPLQQPAPKWSTKSSERWRACGFKRTLERGSDQGIRKCELPTKYNRRILELSAALEPTSTGYVRKTMTKKNRPIIIMHFVS